jgi:hypothetical protein
MPMSETVMFRDPATPFPHNGKFGLGLVATHATARGAVEKVRTRDPRALDDDDHFVSTRSYGVSLSAFDPEGRYAISFTGGFPFGGDVTWQLRGRNYVTVALSITGVEGKPPLGQLYLQHRALNSPYLAGAVGLGARHELLAYPNDSTHPLGGTSTARVASAGVRGFLILRGGRGSRSGISISSYAGFMPRLKEPIVSATLTVGGF